MARLALLDVVIAGLCCWGMAACASRGDEEGPSTSTPPAHVLARAAEGEADPEARLAALEALSRDPLAYAWTHVFWDALPADGGDSPLERRRVWDCLLRVGDAYIAAGEVGAASDFYCDLLESASTSSERCGAIAGLGRASRRRAPEMVFEALEDDDPDVRSAAVAASGSLRWPQARPLFERRLNGAASPLLIDLLRALAMRSEPEAASLAARFLDHQAASVRTAAADAVVRVAAKLDGGDLEALAAPLESAIPLAPASPAARAASEKLRSFRSGRTDAPR